MNPKQHNPFNVTFATLKKHARNGHLRHSDTESHHYKYNRKVGGTPDRITAGRYLTELQKEKGNKIISENAIKIKLVNDFYSINFLVVKPV